MKYNQKTLGVLGGMGPLATAEFLRVLAENTPVMKDQEHPRMIVLSNPSTPDRTKFILGDGISPLPYLKEGINLLREWGADILAVPCNTSHYFLDQILQEISLPIVHIVDETLNRTKELSPMGAWLLATEGTRRTKLYETHAERIEYKFNLPPDKLQEKTSLVIDAVKSNDIQYSTKLISEICAELWGVDYKPIIAACTEIPVAYLAAGLPSNMMVSSTEALALGCINQLYQ